MACEHLRPITNGMIEVSACICGKVKPKTSLWITPAPCEGCKHTTEKPTRVKKEVASE